MYIHTDVHSETVHNSELICFTVRVSPVVSEEADVHVVLALRLAQEPVVGRAHGHHRHHRLHLPAAGTRLHDRAQVQGMSDI